MPSTKTREVLFASRFTELRLIVDSTDYEWKGNRIHGETKGHTIEFHKGTFRTVDPVEIDFLREKIANGESNIREVPAQVPDPSSLLVELVDASEGRVREVLAAERDGWERPEILEVCEKRLATFGTDSYDAGEYESDDPEAPFGRKADGTPRKRAVPAHLRR
jgi:hypothetical protein